jgi:hypothetical protein
MITETISIKKITGIGVIMLYNGNNIYTPGASVTDVIEHEFENDETFTVKNVMVFDDLPGCLNFITNNNLKFDFPVVAEGQIHTIPVLNNQIFFNSTINKFQRNINGNVVTLN